MADVKTAFHQIRRYLARHKERLARVAIGPSFEGWLNAEIALALTEMPGCLKKGEEVWPEKTKRDIVIHRSDESVGWVIEVKLVYPWPPSKMQVPITRLRQQVLARSRRYKDEGPRTRRTGIIFGVWFEPKPDHGHWAKRLDRKDFFRCFRDSILATFNRSGRDGFAIQHETLYYPVWNLRPSGRKEQVTIAMMYVTGRSRAAGSNPRS